MNFPDPLTKISSGNYRSCYTTTDPDICVKKLNPTRPKSYLGLRVNYPMGSYTRLKFGIPNLNSFDRDNILSLRESFPNMFPEKTFLDGAQNLYMTRIRNGDGSYSSNLNQHGEVSNDSFWSELTGLANHFREKQLWYWDIFHAGNNIMVKKNEDDLVSPVIIDCKRLGSRMYPFQPNLRFESQARKRFEKRFKRFEERFKP